MTMAAPLFARVHGIIHSPRATLEAVARAPRWFGVVTCALLLTGAASAILLKTEVGQLALLDQWERTASAFGLRIDDIRYAAMEDASRNGAAYAVVSSLVSGPLLAVGVSVACFVAFRTSKIAARPDQPVLAGRSAIADRRPAAVTFRQVLAVVGHAGVILALRQVIAAPVAYARETLASPTTMSLFFGMLNEASLPARLFGIIDLFVLWWLLVLAIGLSVLYQRPARRVAAVLVGAYLTLAAAMTIVMALAGGTA